MTSDERARTQSQEEERVERDRWEILHQLEAWLETPMLVLGFVWLALLVLELTRGVSPLLETVTRIIWIVFIFDFVLRFVVAPKKPAFLKGNWLTALSLLVPALRLFRFARVLRVARAARAARGAQLVRVVGSLNRGMRALGRTMSRRGLGYIATLTVLITIGGAAGMYALERHVPQAFDSYGDALWWTAMIMTTTGTDYWPQTAEARVLTLILAAYGFAVWGYLTATLATFFIGRDADDEEAEVAGRRSVDALHGEIVALRADVQALRRDARTG